MNPAKRKFGVMHAGCAALVALVALQILWYAWLTPRTGTSPWPLVALTVVPLLPGLWICWRNLRRGVLIGGIVGLFYFCHGVVVAWAVSGQRTLGLAEIALTLILIGALGWDARHYKRKPQS